MLNFLVTCIIAGQIEPKCDARVTADEPKVTGKFWAKNSGKTSFKLRITDSRYNYYKTDLKLPFEVELAPGKSIELTVRPVNSEAKKYGKHAMFSYSLLQNSKIVSNKKIEANRDDNPPSVFGSADNSTGKINGYEVSIHNERSVPRAQLKDLSITYGGKPLKVDLFPSVYKTPEFLKRMFGAVSIKPIKLPDGIIELPSGTLYVIGKVPSISGVKSRVVFKWRRSPAAPWKASDRTFTSDKINPIIGIR